MLVYRLYVTIESSFDTAGEKGKIFIQSKDDQGAFDDKLLRLYKNLKISSDSMYMYEVTTSTRNPDDPLRIRIQTGNNVYDEHTTNSDVNDDNDQWTVLPSNLHLEVLQLVQTPSNEGDETNKSKYQSPEEDYEESVTAYEVFEALNSVYVSDDIDEDELIEKRPSHGSVSIQTFHRVLRDLYALQLIYFESDLEEDGNEDIDPLQFFRGVDIKDLRST